MVLGRHGVLTPDEARAHARTILGAVAAGQDPAKERSQANSGMPIAQLVELFVSEHAKPKRKSQTGPSYLKKPWRAIQRHAGLEGVRIHDLRHPARASDFQSWASSWAIQSQRQRRATRILTRTP